MSTPSNQAVGSPPTKGKSTWQTLYSGLQKVGRSLQLPIAVLPAAGLMLRLGQPDIFGKDGLHWNKLAAIFAGAGSAVMDNLPMLFCVGVAIGFAKKSDGSTALAALVGFLVYHNVLTAFPDDAGKPQNPGVLGGVLVGLTSAWMWQRFHRTKLVDWLGFFNGRRLVPIQMAFIGLLFGCVFGLIWEPIGGGLESFAQWLSDLGAWGAGIYGVVNRLLIPIGMHQFINTYAWFQFGSFTPPGGEEKLGDINRFYAGDPSAGLFTSGFYPIMMFALPAAAMAIAHSAKPERRKATMGMMVSVALTSFVTGVTEPLEFSFMFIAPVLYGLHALLTGASMAITWGLGVKDGFTFSGGLLDYVLAWTHATKPILIIPIGLCFAVVYYAVFRTVIKVMDLPTPGREPEDEVVDTTRA